MRLVGRVGVKDREKDHAVARNGQCRGMTATEPSSIAVKHARSRRSQERSSVRVRECTLLELELKLYPRPKRVSAGVAERFGRADLIVGISEALQAALASGDFFSSGRPCQVLFVASNPLI